MNEAEIKERVCSCSDTVKLRSSALRVYCVDRLFLFPTYTLGTFTLYNTVCFSFVSDTMDSTIRQLSNTIFYTNFLRGRFFFVLFRDLSILVFSKVLSFSPFSSSPRNSSRSRVYNFYSPDSRKSIYGIRKLYNRNFIS